MIVAEEFQGALDRFVFILWGSVDQWLERRADDRGVLGSSLGRAASELWQFR